MIVDTVGFINKIPHSLIEAFKSTLEEVTRADLLLHLVDMTNALYEEQIGVIDRVLGEIGAGEIPTVLVPNKIDLVSPVAVQQLRSRNGLDVCPISAVSGAGVPELLHTVGRIMDREKEPFHACFAPAQGALVALLRQHGRIVQEKYEGDLLRITALVTPKLAGQMRKLLNANGVQAEW